MNDKKGIVKRLQFPKDRSGKNLNRRMRNEDEEKKGKTLKMKFEERKRNESLSQGEKEEATLLFAFFESF